MKLKELNGLLEDNCIAIFDMSDNWKRTIYENNVEEMFDKYDNRDISSIGEFFEYCKPRGLKIILK